MFQVLCPRLLGIEWVNETEGLYSYEVPLGSMYPK